MHLSIPGTAGTPCTSHQEIHTMTLNTISEAIEQFVDEQIDAAFNDRRFESAVESVVETALEETNFLTRDDFDPDSIEDLIDGDALIEQHDILTASNFDPSDYGLVDSSDLPDFDDFIRQGESDVEDGVVNLLQQYSPFGCSTARTANAALALFLGAALTTEQDSRRRIEQADDVQAALVTFIAANTEAIDKARADLKAIRKAEAKQAKRDAEQAAKQAKRAAKAARKAEAAGESVVSPVSDEEIPARPRKAVSKRTTRRSA